MTLPDHVNVALIAGQRLACTFEVDGLLGLFMFFGPLLDHSLHRRRTGLVVKWRLSLCTSCFPGRVRSRILLTVRCGSWASVMVNVVSCGDRRMANSKIEHFFRPCSINSSCKVETASSFAIFTGTDKCGHLLTSALRVILLTLYPS